MLWIKIIQMFVSVLLFSAFRSLHFNKIIIIIIIIILTSLKTIPRMAHILLYIPSANMKEVWPNPLQQASTGWWRPVTFVISIYCLWRSCCLEMFHIPTATDSPSCYSYILWNVDQSDSVDGLFRLSHFQCEHTSHRNPDEKLQHEKWSLFVPSRTHCDFPSFSPHPLNLFWSVSCLLHTSVPSLTLPSTFTPLFLITPLSHSVHS